ncbi:hypothetical protein CYJ61_01565 [Gardnerella leopoldii]|uniref:Uncharacterized protein n=1 Tax=Gardnerella vaginalis TaxID=2702 RepID=A0AAP8LSH6_GARVA|nr:hypothetical protein CYJ61_01565 [Gardnerella vaginalis]
MLTLRLKLCSNALQTLLMKLCSNALLTAIICCLVNFNSIALRTLISYCPKNTSVIAAAHAIPGTPTTTPKTTVGEFTSGR